MPSMHTNIKGHSSFNGTRHLSLALCNALQSQHAQRTGSPQVKAWAAAAGQSQWSTTATNDHCALVGIAPARPCLRCMTSS